MLEVNTLPGMSKTSLLPMSAKSKGINFKNLVKNIIKLAIKKLKGGLMKVVATSGYFDPLHVGHLECLELAFKLGDKLIVIVNSDFQAKLKKGESFMNESDRMKIVAALKCVDEVFFLLTKINHNANL